MLKIRGIKGIRGIGGIGPSRHIRRVGAQRDIFMQRLRDTSFRKSMRRQRFHQKQLHRYRTQRLKYNV